MTGGKNRRDRPFCWTDFFETLFLLLVLILTKALVELSNHVTDDYPAKSSALLIYSSVFSFMNKPLPSMQTVNR